MARYKWDTAYEWLAEQVDGWDAEKLRSELLAFAAEAGNDDIQDRYQDEMDDDGFFQDLDICRDLSRKQCTDLLTGAGIEVYDDEPIETLREAVEANLEDGTLSYQDVESA